MMTMTMTGRASCSPVRRRRIYLAVGLDRLGYQPMVDDEVEKVTVESEVGGGRGAMSV